MQLILPNNVTVYGTADELVNFLNKYQLHSVTTTTISDPKSTGSYYDDVKTIIATGVCPDSSKEA